MAFSIEARVPFTDTELFTFLSTVPVGRKFPLLEKKHLLKRAMRGSLPERVARKKKVGLEIPYSDWMRNRLREITLDYLSPDRLGRTGLFDPAGVHALWERHDRKLVDNGRALWGLLNYMMWYDLYIESTRYRSHIRPGIPRNVAS
jgi:asparagine synthase (glutamine-hydrolysing)